MNSIMEKAQNALEKGKPGEALRLFNQEISENAGNAMAYQGAALSSYRLKDLESAIAFCKKALEMEPALFLPHLILAEIFNEVGELVKSREEMRVAYSLNPDSPEVLSSLGAFLLMDNRFEEAIPLLEKVVEQSASNYNARYNLVIAHSKQGNTKRAFDHVKALYHIRPSIENGIRVFIAFMNRWKLYKTFGIFVFLIAVIAIVLRDPTLLTIFALMVGFLVGAGIYLKVKEVR